MKLELVAYELKAAQTQKDTYSTNLVPQKRTLSTQCPSMYFSFFLIF